MRKRPLLDDAGGRIGTMEDLVDAAGRPLVDGAGRPVERFHSSILPPYLRKTQAIEELMWKRGTGSHIEPHGTTGCAHC